MANASNYFYEISRLKDGRTIKSLAKELMGNRFPSKSGERYFLNQLIEARSPKKVANIIRPYYDKTPININTMGKKTGEIARTPVDTTPMVNTYGESVPLDQWRKKGSISLNEPLSPNKGTKLTQTTPKASQLTPKAELAQTPKPISLSKPSEKFSFVQELKRKLVDSTSPLEATLASAEKAGKFKVIPKNDIRLQIDKVLRSDSLATQFIKDNNLEKVIRSVDNLDEFNQYLISKQAKDVAQKGIRTGRNIARDNQFVKSVANKYEPLAQEVYNYNRKLLDYLTDSGMISKELNSTLKKEYPNYVPLNRVFSEIEQKAMGVPGRSKGLASQGTQNVVKKLKGSERDIEDPIESIISKTAQSFQDAEKNRAAQMLTSYKDLPGNPFNLSEIKGAQPLSREQKIKVSNLRGKQFAKLMATRGKTSGEQGYFAELGALKGGAKKVDYDTIRPNLQQGDIDTLFNRVNDANIGEWEKLSAKGALTKLLSKEGATIPTQNELKLLNEVFGSEFTKSILDKRSVWQKILSGAGEALNLPRSLMASFDLSAPLRQGLVMTSRPKQFFPAFLSMFKQAGSDKAFKAVQESITQRQTYKLMRESKLALTDMSPLMTNREETFMSNLGEKIPGVKYGVKASSRAYTGFLNKLRADVFDDMVSKAKSLGLNEKTVASDIAKFVNSATGRGDLGRLNNAATALNGVFFSPRLMASRINLLNPAYYVGLDPFVRKQAVKSMLTMGALAGSTLGLAKATEAHSRPDSPPLAG